MKIGNLKLIQSKMCLSIIFVLIFCLFNLTSSKCSDRPQCFKKVVFNYNLPEMNLYQMNGTDNNFIEYSIKAYGDFNNDLYTDFMGINEEGDLLVFAWNSDTLLYQKVFQGKMVDEYMPKSIYLLDFNGDGRLDFVVWGLKTIQQGKSQNCLVPYVRLIATKAEQLTNDDNKYIFKNTTILKMPLTSDPIIIGHQFNSEIDGVGFMIFMNGQRTFLKYKEAQSANPSFESIKWNVMAESQFDFSAKSFHHPHSNTFLDLTGDCIPDLVVMNEDKKLEIWIGDSKKFKFDNYIETDPDQKGVNLRGFTFNDINYDGSIDIIFIYQKIIRVQLNHRSLTTEEQFCCNGCTNFELNEPIDIPIPEGKTIKEQAVHFGDINIDGYPDLLMILIDDKTKNETPLLFENLFDVGKNLFTPFTTPIYNEKLSLTPENTSVLSVSFIDILENGILDLIVSYNQSGKFQTQMLYNNFLFQNDFYIKGFGLLGPHIDLGSQYPGMSFYWVNSVNDGFKITYQAQMTQTSYDALQMPYTFCGLGRANNYVQSFTVGRNGKKQEWSPIIPNSQLGVFTINDNEEKWKIRIFAFPFYEFITVIIVTGIILTIFGVFLMYIKCKGYKKKEQPLEIQFIN